MPKYNIIEFSKYITISFLRIENIDSMFKKYRMYTNYLKIPKILNEYLKDEQGEDNRNKQLERECNKLNEDMHNSVLLELQKTLKEDTNHCPNFSDIDKLNSIININYGIDEEHFFDSFSTLNSYDTIDDDDISKDLEDTVLEYLKKYEGITNRKELVHVSKSAKRDLQVCSIISACELTNALHHIYKAYYKCENGEYRAKNVSRAINHLKRAILDMKEVDNLTDQKIIKYNDVKQRLNKIINVGES